MTRKLPRVTWPVHALTVEAQPRETQILEWLRAEGRSCQCARTSAPMLRTHRGLLRHRRPRHHHRLRPHRNARRHHEIHLHRAHQPRWDAGPQHQRRGAGNWFTGASEDGASPVKMAGLTSPAPARCTGAQSGRRSRPPGTRRWQAETAPPAAIMRTVCASHPRSARHCRWRWRFRRRSSPRRGSIRKKCG